MQLFLTLHRKHGHRHFSACGIACAATALIALPWRAAAATLRVPASFPTIQAAINAAAPDDTVLVGPGLYDENVDTGAKPLTLIGEAGAGVTIVDGGYRASVLRFTAGGLVQGFTFRHGQAQWGGGIFVGGTAFATIRGNIVEENIAGYFVDSGLGGGIYVDQETRALVEANMVGNNYAGDSGGGIYDDGAVAINQVLRNTITGNGCHVGGGGARLTATEFSGNLVVGNWSDHFGAGVYGGGIRIIGNTIVENYTISAGQAGTGVHLGDTNPNAIISHNLIAFNYGPPGAQVGVGFLCDDNFRGAPRIECNDSWGNDGGDYLFYGACDTTGMRNFSADPLFCGREAGQFTIGDRSPCAPSGGSGCGLIGAFPVACTITPTQRSTWGELKVRYR